MRGERGPEGRSERGSFQVSEDLVEEIQALMHKLARGECLRTQDDRSAAAEEAFSILASKDMDLREIFQALARH